MNIFKIYIRDLKLNVVIGILENERKSKQKIIVNCQIEYDLNEHFLDYVQSVEAITNLLEYKKYKTLESALSGICKALKSDFPEIVSIKLKIDKPEVFKNTLVGVEVVKKYSDIK